MGQYGGGYQGGSLASQQSEGQSSGSQLKMFGDPWSRMMNESVNLAFFHRHFVSNRKFFLSHEEIQNFGTFPKIKKEKRRKRE